MQHTKLTGQAYIDHWVNRIAKGPQEAGLEKNGDDTWNFIKGFLSDFQPRTILEFGCSWGRMLRRIHAYFPKAKLYGVDLSPVALEGLKSSWPDTSLPTLFNQSEPPRHIRVDMIFTCTVIQHITDPDVLARVFDGFRAILRPGGKIVMFENVNWGKGKGGIHMSELSASEYMGLWPELYWEDCGSFMHGIEKHELMIGTRE